MEKHYTVEYPADERPAVILDDQGVADKIKRHAIERRIDLIAARQELLALGDEDVRDYCQR